MKARTVTSPVDGLRLTKVAAAPAGDVRSQRRRRLRCPIGALLRLLSAFGIAVETRAALSLKLLLPRPKWFYNGTYLWVCGCAVRQHTALVRLLLAAFLLVFDTQAALSIKLSTTSPVPRWFYNGTHASPACETTFRCETSKRSGTVPSCSCHANCSLYDACCEDVRPNDWRLLVLPPDAYECAAYPYLVTDERGNTYVSSADFVFVITKCPSTYGVPRVAMLCGGFNGSANDSILAPWVTETTTGVTFRNQFCALCHGVTAKRMYFWKTTTTCITDYFETIFGFSGCKHNVLPPVSEYIGLPKCWGTYRSSCVNGSSKQMKESCENSPTRYVYDQRNFVAYRNYNCSLCTSPSLPANIIPNCIIPQAIIEFPSSFDVHRLVSTDVCPKKLSAFASKNDETAFHELCPDTVFEFENCSETVNGTTALLTLYSGDDSLEYRIMPSGVRLLLNDTYSVCYPCVPHTAYNYTLKSNYVVLLAPNDTYTKPLYQIEDNGSIIVCSAAKKVDEFVPAATCSTLPSEVSVVLTSLSLFGLMMYVIAYSFLRSMRNLHGSIVMHQSVYFSVALLLWLVRSQAGQGSHMCVIFAVVIHSSFVAGFFWTTVYAIEMLQLLSSRAHRHVKTPLWYNVYTAAGNVVPQLILVVASVVNWAPPSWVDRPYRPQYGTPECFINSPVAHRIFFIAPLAMFLLVDLAIYVFVIVRVTRNSLRKNVVCQKQRDTLLLAIKLLLSLGPTCIVAVLSTATENCYIGYVFSLLISLQGVLLFLIFICNANTLKKISQKVLQRHYNASRSKTRCKI